MTEDQIFIGVDGGGSGCRAVVATQTKILGEGRGGPANVSTDSAGAIDNVLTALEQARLAAGVADLSGALAHLGVAGVLTPEHAGHVSAAMPMEKATVTDDRPTMITGALGDADGTVAAIGTGSFIGTKRKAAYQFSGGWGLVLGDEASAAWLGRAALSETLLAQDGLRNGTVLSTEILSHFNDDPNEIVAFAAIATPSHFGRFAPRVSAAAQDGDPLGVELMQLGADYIGRAINHLHSQSVGAVCLTGSLGPFYAPFLSPTIRAQLTPAIGTALDGALTLARAMG